MGSSSVTTSGTKKKKKGVFKTIAKGFATKKKKQRPDDDSVIGVDVDRRVGFADTPSSAAGGGGTAPRNGASAGDEHESQIAVVRSSPPTRSSSSSRGVIAKPIRVVLLLMDPGSRRFELLQLEFDSTKAVVSDVMHQIQTSATEKALRDKAYVGVCDQSGMEMASSMKLSKFCKGNDVVMAIPTGMTGRETAKLGGPILGDRKVEDMLAPCGVQIQNKSLKKIRSLGAKKLTKISEGDVRQKDSKPSSFSPPRTKSSSGAGTAQPRKLSSGVPTALLGMAILLLLLLTTQHHMRITCPIEPGQILLPGQWRSQCGIFDLLPIEWLEKFPMSKLSQLCDTSSSSMLEFGADSNLRYFKRDGSHGTRKEVWSIAVSGQESQCADNNGDQCTDKGATFVKDGSQWYVEVGGSRTALGEDAVKDFMT